jgi:hypothetical protein
MERNWFSAKDAVLGNSMCFDANQVMGVVIDVIVDNHKNELFSIVFVHGTQCSLNAKDFSRLKQIIGYPFGEFQVD